jgi:hypothetical protein
MLKSRVVDNLVPDERSDRELMQRALDDLMTAYAVNELYQTGKISDKAPIMQTITALRERLADPYVESKRLALERERAESWKAHAQNLMKKLKEQDNV